MKNTVAYYLTSGVISQYPILQECLESTDWSDPLSPSDDINMQVDVVSSYVSFCKKTIIPSKTVTIFPNKKPWVTKELKEIVNRKKHIFFSGSELEKRRSTKTSSEPSRLSSLTTTGEPPLAWQGLRTPPPPVILTSQAAAIPNDLITGSSYTQ